VAMLATMAVMLLTGQSINMVSLFAMIMALGIVVDDAIVVGEHADAQRRAGLSPLAAAETSAGSMGAPVLASSLTTVAAFLPLFVIGDIIGKIIVAIPYVIVTVIFASLIECFFVLPAHMRAALRGDPGRASRLRDWLDRHFDRFRDGPFRRTVLLAVQWRYATLALSLAALILSIGLVAGARLTFHFFPAPEPDKLYANLQMVAGTPRETTAAMLDEMERALRVAEDRLTEGRGGLVRMAAGHLGMAVGEQDTFRAQGGDEIGGFVVELAPSDERDVRTGAFIEAWKAAILPRPGLEALTVLPAQGGPPGRELDIRLTAADPEALKAASDAVKALIARFPGVSDVKDDLPYGKRETVLTLTPQGQAMGLTTESVARQVRAAYDGAVAMRFPRGDEEVTVRVRYPLADADAGLLERLRLRGPQGAEIALEDAVSRREKQGFARIPREDGSREIAITGEIDDAVTNGDEVLDGLRRAGLFDIAAKYGVSVAFAGKAEEQAQTLGDMRAGGMLGLAMIYIVLAWVFASYLRPLAVMAVIPLGFVGTVIGHLLLGYDLTILSLVALVGLSGILVNDSIILVGTIDARIRGGQPVRKAIVDGTCERLRAVILTSATTIGGLAPLLFEGSFQAQFLIPMAVTMVFGLLVTTLVVLFLVPALIAVQGDVAARFGRQVGAVAQRRRAQEG
ncbi:MAG: efflux RND transporter permease subunit, partial [Alphaproteobacteria bacterium]